MEFLDKKATIVFTKLLNNLKDGEYNKIINEPFMPLTIERINKDIHTVWGKANIYSLCHYYKENGELMQDPEMCFFVIDERNGFLADYDQIKIAPISFQQANGNIFQESVLIENFTITKFRRAQQKEHNEFANIWLMNIQAQGFLNHLL